MLATSVVPTARSVGTTAVNTPLKSIKRRTICAYALRSRVPAGRSFAAARDASSTRASARALRFHGGRPPPSCMKYCNISFEVENQTHKVRRYGSRGAAASLLQLQTKRTFLEQLPGDPEEGGPPREVQGAAWTRVTPTPASCGAEMARLVAYSEEVAALLGVEASAAQLPRQAIEVLAGARALPGGDPYAACYGGHQFGTWAGQLGDGRAITLAEVEAPSGRQELQLKGAGRTPYSRFADGRAVLRSSIREYIMSEAMAGLGIPTTRALSLVATGDGVVRDMYYSGDAKPEPGAVVARVAPTFLRFGSFELPFSRKDPVLLEQLFEYAARHFFRDVSADAPREQRVTEVFAEIVRRSAELVAMWQCVGFTHGYVPRSEPMSGKRTSLTPCLLSVLNTDNMSILGLTIDYGPFGFMSTYDEDYVPNTSDRSGRYRFGNQPVAVKWNCSRLGSALTPLCPVEPLSEALEQFDQHFDAAMGELQSKKLGFREWRPADDQLWRGLTDLMANDSTDYTKTLRTLSSVSTSFEGPSVDELPQPLLDVLTSAGVAAPARLHAWASWLSSYAQRLRDNDGMPESERKGMQDAANPRFVLQNWQIHVANVAAELGDFSEIHRLSRLVQRPFEDGDVIPTQREGMEVPSDSDMAVDDAEEAVPSPRELAWTQVLGDKGLPDNATHASPTEKDMLRFAGYDYSQPLATPSWATRPGVSLLS